MRADASSRGGQSEERTRKKKKIESVLRLLADRLLLRHRAVLDARAFAVGFEGDSLVAGLGVFFFFGGAEGMEVGLDSRDEELVERWRTLDELF